ncbi:MAG: DUF3891 family protein [Verrucomicrobiota bacterium]
MIVRHRDDGVEAISQHAHSWLCAQFGRHWAWPHPLGEPGSPLVEEFLLGAAEHDIGYLEWEAAPQLDPRTGLPFNFLKMPSDEHLCRWRTGIARLRPTSLLGSLMVSHHAYRIVCPDTEDELHGKTENGEVRAFLEEQRRYQEQATRDLVPDPRYARLRDPEVQNRMTLLLRVWDLLSLYLCMDLAGPERIPQTPSADGVRELVFTRRERNRYALAPWPFRLPKLTGHVARRRLRDRYRDEAEMRAHLTTLAPDYWEFTLEPGEEA